MHNIVEQTLSQDKELILKTLINVPLRKIWVIPNFFLHFLLKPSLTGQGAHTKNISQCFKDSDMDYVVENGEELEESSFNLPEVNVEITPPPMEFALVTPLEDEMEESLS